MDWPTCLPDLVKRRATKLGGLMQFALSQSGAKLRLFVCDLFVSCACVQVAPSGST